MSIIFVFVGQCGNQVGAAVAKKLAENCYVGPSSLSSRSNNSNYNNNRLPPPHQPTSSFSGPFFGADGYFRSVLVDCEPKVVDSVVKSCAQHNIFIRPTNLVTGRSGRGNSWSLGYCGLPETDEAEIQSGAFRVSCQTDQLERDRTVLCRALKALHAETRRCDDGMIEAIVVVHSLAGGTGSGLGCALVENIRHHFCCNGDIHDDLLLQRQNSGDNHEGYDDDDDQKNNNDGDRYDHVAAQFFARGKRTNSTSNEDAKTSSRRRVLLLRQRPPLPPSIIPQDMIREGAYGEPRKARYIVSVCVAPLVQGELAVQSINASLTLRTLVKNCDAVILLRNDCQKMVSSTTNFGGGGGGTTDRKLGAAAASTTNRASSFEVINNFFATLLVGALQGGNSFGCINELLEAAVFRVGGEELSWDQQQSQQQNLAENHHDDPDDDQDGEVRERVKILLTKATPTSSVPLFGPRLLTLIPWEPRSGWIAGFRHSSVTATLVRPPAATSSFSSFSSSNATPGQQHDSQLLQAFLCNEVKGSDSDIFCTIIDRDDEIRNLVRLGSENLKHGSSASSSSSYFAAHGNRSIDRSKQQRDGDNLLLGPDPKTTFTKQDELVVGVQQQYQLHRQQAKPSSSSSSSSSFSLSTSCSSPPLPVLVLNQCSELATSILFSFFRDAAAKVDTGAYMHAFNTRGILSQMFSSSSSFTTNTAITTTSSAFSGRGKSVTGNNPHQRSAHRQNSNQNNRRVSPRRNGTSENKNTAFAREFVNAALIELLEYITETFPGL